MHNDVLNETKKKMDATIEVFKKDLAGVRTGRANSGMLNNVMVDYYGAMTPLPQVATVTAADGQMLVVSPFDKSATKEIEKAIRNSDLNLNANVDGTVIRVPVPMLTEERRKELVKHVKKMGEDTKVAIRNVRRDANDKLKKMEKDKQISQDILHQAEEKTQSATDAHVKNIDALVVAKEKELMTV